MTKTDEELITEMDHRVKELNALISEAADRDIEIELDRFSAYWSVGSSVERISYLLRAKKILKPDKYIASTGGF